MKWATTILVFCVAVLIGLGLVMLYSSSMDLEVGKTEAGAHYLLSQLVWCGIGLAGCVIAACTDYRRWKKIAPWLLGSSVVLLIAVFVPGIGIGLKGAHRWIGRPHLPHFQPSELARLSLIIFLAVYCERFQRQIGYFRQGVLIPGCFLAMVLGLIFIEPDRGCTILLASVTGIMLIIAGVRLRYFVIPALLFVGGLSYSLMHDTMRLKRIAAWLHPETARDGAGYQAWQAMIALGSGGWMGLGLGNSRQKLDFLPEHHTDFIFSVIGEELGLITTLCVLILFIAIVVCGIYISRRAKDTFGLLLGTGITFMIGLQAFINMGVNTSLLPNKGMPLPFISYGGSNLMLTLVAVGLLLSISRYGIEPTKRRANPFETSPELNEPDA